MQENLVTTRDNVLVAERTIAGHSHYIEFRLRPSPVLPAGHMFVVYGELDENGLPKTFNYTGLYPKGAVVGLYSGIIIPVAVPANTEPSLLDCNFLPISSYRRSVTAVQYDRLLQKVAAYHANPPKWAVFSFNCNHYAASLGEAVGLKGPLGPRSQQSWSNIYFKKFVVVNGDVIHRKTRS